jgi:hypothetical protein
MKLKSILAVGLLMSAFASVEAHAADCSLTVNPGSFIPRGWAYSYGIDMSDFGPLPPGPFTVVFYGTKNGVADIPPGGETYPGAFPWGHIDLTGYLNPSSGGLTGNYTRYAVIYDPNHAVYCVTNQIAVTLQ